MLQLDRPRYCPDLLVYRRRKTRVVMVGDVAVGGDNPIRVQSMTTTLTKDVPATVDQVERLVRVGCEIVRITTPTPADARCLGPIKEELGRRGIHVPIVADIHFSPQAAMVAAEYADKVRINPGNYVDSRKFAVREYSDAEYEDDLERVEERFTPLVLKCKERGISMRIGTNHGSLSDRIMNRFGDTPEGMVESALEFVRVCERYDYHDIILSMKASNPKVMIAAYRLLAARMHELGMEYPFHLGVTEAGNAEDGRIKSAIGIGSLLADGIGDTIRVSLTEEPEAEVPVAYELAGRTPPLARSTFNVQRSTAPVSSPVSQEPGTRSQEPGTDNSEPAWDPFHYERRPAMEVTLGDVRIGGRETIAVVAAIDGPLSAASFARPRLLRWASPAGRRQPKPDAARVELATQADVGALERAATELRKLPGARLAILAVGNDPCLLRAALAWADGVILRLDAHTAPMSLRHGTLELLSAVQASGKLLCLEAPIDDERTMAPAVETLVEAAATATDSGVRPLLTLAVDDRAAVHGYRLLAVELSGRALQTPILLQVSPCAAMSDFTTSFHVRPPAPLDGQAEPGCEAAGPGVRLEPHPVTPLLAMSVALGSPLCDGIGDAVMITGVSEPEPVTLSFNILQAAGARLSKTDYVACPSCGRTLFDLQETTERIKARTSHLVGVRLAIMGCIVNGPGEMADADFGYVGGAPGRVNLYVGKECVEKGVPAEDADDRLIALIKSHGKWQEAEPDVDGA